MAWNIGITQNSGWDIGITQSAAGGAPPSTAIRGVIVRGVIQRPR